MHNIHNTILYNICDVQGDAEIWKHFKNHGRFWRKFVHINAIRIQIKAYQSLNFKYKIYAPRECI